ncbi:MAG: AI-2E family transporter, partial [Muribaculaceae bacterium]|nr:AI-2E family transporter [Muribaculaceae bacterium]
VLLPFCVACLIAYIFEPFVQYNRRLLKLKGRVAAIFVTLFEVLLFLGILAYFTIPMIIDEMRQMAALLERYATTEVSIQFLPPGLHDFLRQNIDFKALGQRLVQQDFNALAQRFISVVNGGLHVVLAVAGWLMVLLYVVFIMLDYERLMAGFRLLVPRRLRPLAGKIGNDIKESMNHYFRGQALMAVCVAFIYCVGFYICDLPLAIVLGLGTGVLFMIPYFQFLTIIPVTLLCLVCSVDGTADFWGQWWSCMAVFAVVQIVADLILMPRIMGKAMGLNPAIILLSLSIWGTLFGIIGMIIALPLTTLLLSYYDQYIIRHGREASPADSPIE